MTEQKKSEVPDPTPDTRHPTPLLGPTPVLALVGPTGTGKTALALEIAELLNAEIVNLDSRQVYRGLDVGSAKPRSADQARVPHHLFDVVAPDAVFDCARYRELALAAIADITRRQRRVLLVGGTGLYLRVLRHGLFAGPPRNATLRAELEDAEAAAPGTLHGRLAQVDIESANRIHPHDRVRLVRALEVWQLTGRRLSVWHREHVCARSEMPMVLIGLTLDRATLYARLNARCRTMVEEGLIDEVRALWAAGYDPSLAPLRSIGYREIGDHLLGRYDLPTALDAMARATRHLAKRQLTWFRADPAIRWHDAERLAVATLAETAQRAIAALTE